MKIAIIGAGIFGLSAGIKISENKKNSVFIFDKSEQILSGSTFANHNRHHYGFHYPRSQRTLNQINNAKDEFEYYYKSACNFNFKNYYAVAKKSLISSNNYENFLLKNNLKYEKVKTKSQLFNQSQIETVFQVREGVYEFEKIKKIVKKRLNKNIKLKLNHQLISGKKINSGYSLNFLNKKNLVNLNFDFVINSTYSNINEILGLFKKRKNKYEYNLQQLAIITFPRNERIGITVVDGHYPSFLPIGKSNRHLFAHVIHSQLIKKETTKNLFLETNYIKDNYEMIKRESEKILPILKNSRYHGSIFVNRVVKKNKRDDRLSDLLKHEKNFYSILGGKIITCENTANKLKEYTEKL